MLMKQGDDGYLLSVEKPWSINKSVFCVYFFFRKNSLILSVFNLFFM